MRKTLVAAAVLAFVSVGSFAQTAPDAAASTPRIDKRQTLQQQRIDKAQASGALNEKEAGRLEKRQEHVANVEEKTKADGTVTAKERVRVRRAEHRNSRAIHHQAHDKQASAPN